MSLDTYLKINAVEVLCCFGAVLSEVGVAGNLPRANVRHCSGEFGFGRVGLEFRQSIIFSTTILWARIYIVSLREKTSA